MQKKQKIYKKKWLDIQKETGRCRYCHTIRDLSKDHIVPKSRGGRNHKDNYQVLCRFCNGKKGALMDLEVADIFKDIEERGIWYEWEVEYESWLDYIKIKREEYSGEPLSF